MYHYILILITAMMTGVYHISASLVLYNLIVTINSIQQSAILDMEKLEFKKFNSQFKYQTARKKGATKFKQELFDTSIYSLGQSVRFTSHETHTIS